MWGVTTILKKVRNNDCCVADICRKLMDNPEVAVMIRELRTSTSDANDLGMGVFNPQLDFVWKLTWILTLVMSIQTVKAERRPRLRILVMGH